MKRYYYSDLKTKTENYEKEESDVITIDSENQNKANGVLIVDNNDENIKVIKEQGLCYIAYVGTFSSRRPTRLDTITIDLNSNKSYRGSKDSINTTNEELKELLELFKYKMAEVESKKKAVPIYLGLDRNNRRIFYDMKDIMNISVESNDLNNKKSFIDNITYTLDNNGFDIDYSYIISANNIEYYLEEKYKSEYSNIEYVVSEFDKRVVLYEECKQFKPFIIFVNDYSSLDATMRNKIVRMSLLGNKYQMYFVIMVNNGYSVYNLKSNCRLSFNEQGAKLFTSNRYARLFKSNEFVYRILLTDEYGKLV